MILTDDQNEKIGKVIKFELHKVVETIPDDFIYQTFVCSCGFKTKVSCQIAAHLFGRTIYPDFSTSDGQKILAKALLEERNKSIFFDWRQWQYKKKGLTTSCRMVEIIAETKLAELFLEFLEERE